MKKFINYSFTYAILALLGGVFYREFTKFNDFTGTTVLSKVHVHLFVLGMLLFLFLSFALKNIKYEECKLFKPFMYTYNSGLCLSVIMMIVKGIIEVINNNPSSSLLSALAGIAGIGHILLASGIILLFIFLKKLIKNETK